MYDFAVKKPQFDQLRMVQYLYYFWAQIEWACENARRTYFRFRCEHSICNKMLYTLNLHNYRRYRPSCFHIFWNWISCHHIIIIIIRMFEQTRESKWSRRSNLYNRFPTIGTDLTHRLYFVLYGPWVINSLDAGYNLLPEYIIIIHRLATSYLSIILKFSKRLYEFSFFLYFTLEKFLSFIL